MSEQLTPEKLKTMSKEDLIILVGSLQNQLSEMNAKLDHLIEQIAIASNQRFGRSTEKLSALEGQGYFDMDGNVCFNETEAVHDANPDPAEPTVEDALHTRPKRRKGKKETDLLQFPVVQLPTIDVPEEDRVRVFGSLDNCRRLDDEVIRRLIYIPAGWKVEETHVAVYCSKSGKKEFLKGEVPAYLLRGSLVTPSLESAIINGKYANALPYRRLEKEFEQHGVYISEQNMASWTIKCAERYLKRLYDYLHMLLLTFHVIQADETRVEVVKDGRKAGALSYMWVFRTGRYCTEHPIVLYDYQLTRSHEHPLRFLEGFLGYLVCDGFPGYKTMARKAGGIRIAECYAHARRKFTDAVKAAGKSGRAKAAEEAIRMLGAIYDADKKLKDLSPEERQKSRGEKVRPLVDAFFAWLHEIAEDKNVLMSGATRDGVRYCLNQEEYLYTFLEDGEIPLDNNCTEATIRGFTVGRKNWVTIDTISGANASAIIYSLVETARANSLNIYRYFEYLLTELPKLKEFTSPEEEAAAMGKLLPWSKDLPEICHKRGR